MVTPVRKESRTGTTGTTCTHRPHTRTRVVLGNCLTTVHFVCAAGSENGQQEARSSNSASGNAHGRRKTGHGPALHNQTHVTHARALLT